MDKHEIKARIDAQTDEWNNNIATMKAKADAATGDAKVAYQENVGQLQKQLSEFKVKAAAAWDVADDKFEEAGKDLELAWSEWELRARTALNELMK